MDKFVGDIFINVGCNVGYWIHLHEQSTILHTFRWLTIFRLWTEEATNFEFITRVTSTTLFVSSVLCQGRRASSFDLHMPPYYAVGSSFVPGCVSSPDLRRSFFVSSRMPASRHFWQIIWRYNSIQTNYVCIFVLLTVDWDCFLLSFFSYLSPRLTFVYFVYFVSSFLLYTISCQ